MKYKVGDKVKVRTKIESGTMYGGWTFLDDMTKYKGQIMTIEKVASTYYDLAEDKENYSWTDGMLIKPRASELALLNQEPQTSTNINIDISKLIDVAKDMAVAQAKQNEKTNLTIENMLENVEKSINRVSDMVGKKSIYDDSIVEYILDKVKEIPNEEIHKSIEKKIDKYVKDNYGTLPKKVEVVNNGDVKKIDGIFHNKFEQILKIINKGVPLMLTGPAGAGKNHTLEQVAEALDLDFYFTNAVTQEYKLTGFIDANGIYQETQFFKAFRDGGLFFLDEVDASCPEALIILNAAIANGYFDFPIGKVEVNKNFRVACAGNTYGTGADMVYVGRNVLDGATLDRFATIDFDYDQEVEKQLAYDDELYNFIVDLRTAIKNANLRYIVSMRATINATKLLEIDMPKKDILKSVILKNMQIDDLNMIINKMNRTSGEWYQLLKDYTNARN